METAGGIVMILSALLAILFANSGFSESYHALTHAPIAMGFDVHHTVNDLLMVVFFFAVGLELKCEMREGALSAPGQKILPLMAALGGIILPAIFYLIITRNHPEAQAGWAIPTATDIAFALCVLRLIGPIVPQPAKVFLLAIAIYDDLAAILIIAFFYSALPGPEPLIAAGLLCGILFLMNRRHLDAAPLYLVVGAGLWLAIYHAGVHPTVAGVITALAIPMRDRKGRPLAHHLLHKLHPFVAYGVLPIFAFTSAGVDLRGLTLEDAMHALPVGIAIALVLGKQLGIFGATWLAVRLHLAPLPNEVSWGMVYGLGIIAGIGFTMSLFIGQLAFPGAESMELVKLGVIAGSLISAALGVIFLRLRRIP